MVLYVEDLKWNTFGVIKDVYYDETKLKITYEIGEMEIKPVNIKKDAYIGSVNIIDKMKGDKIESINFKRKFKISNKVNKVGYSVNLSNYKPINEYDDFIVLLGEGDIKLEVKWLNKFG